jgi:CRP-like cAMP-binding protein
VLRQSNIKKRETFTEILSYIDLLKILNKHQMMFVLDTVHLVEYPERTEIIKQEDEDESFYKIIEGEFGVSKPL